MAVELVAALAPGELTVDLATFTAWYCQKRYREWPGFVAAIEEARLHPAPEPQLATHSLAQSPERELLHALQHQDTELQSQLSQPVQPTASELEQLNQARSAQGFPLSHIEAELASRFENKAAIEALEVRAQLRKVAREGGAEPGWFRSGGANVVSGVAAEWSSTAAMRSRYSSSDRPLTELDKLFAERSNRRPSVPSPGAQRLSEGDNEPEHLPSAVSGDWSNTAMMRSHTAVTRQAKPLTEFEKILEERRVKLQQAQAQAQRAANQEPSQPAREAPPASVGIPDSGVKGLGGFWFSGSSKTKGTQG